MGYGGFAIESVAARAGVGRATIYRHWDGKLALIADALEVLNEQPGPELGGSPRERVEQILLHLVDVLDESPFSACIPALIHAADHDPTVRAFHQTYNARRRAALVDSIAEGATAGDFPADTDPEVAALALAGALFYRRLMTDQPPTPLLVTALVETVLQTPRGTAGSAGKE